MVVVLEPRFASEPRDASFRLDLEMIFALVEKSERAGADWACARIGRRESARLDKLPERRRAATALVLVVCEPHDKLPVRAQPHGAVAFDRPPIAVSRRVDAHEKPRSAERPFDVEPSVVLGEAELDPLRIKENAPSIATELAAGEGPPAELRPCGERRRRRAVLDESAVEVDESDRLRRLGKRRDAELAQRVVRIIDDGPLPRQHERKKKTDRLVQNTRSTLPMPVASMSRKSSSVGK